MVAGDNRNVGARPFSSHDSRRIQRISSMKCRHCQNELTTTFVDLGSAPPSNAYLTEAQMKAPEKWFPLKVMVCDQCWLVQTEDYTGAEELFDADYAYFSSYSTSWLRHAEAYVRKMVERFQL